MHKNVFNLAERLQFNHDQYRARTYQERAMWEGVVVSEKSRLINKGDVVDFIRGSIVNTCPTGTDDSYLMSLRRVPTVFEMISDDMGRRVVGLFLGLANCYNASGLTEEMEKAEKCAGWLETVRFTKGRTFMTEKSREGKARDAIGLLMDFVGGDEGSRLSPEERQRLGDIVAYHFMKKG